MTNEQAIYCLKAFSGRYPELCEDCSHYSECDHSYVDDILDAIIQRLEQIDGRTEN